MAETTSTSSPLTGPCLELLDDPRIEAFGMLLETHNELQNVITHQLEAEAALSVPWMGVLIRLARSPGQRLRMTELARDMTMSTSGLTRLIDRIEGAGHVRREPCPHDRRGFHAVLTPAGLEVVSDASTRHVADLETYLAAPLTPEQLTQLTDLLRIVRDHIRGS